ncbi:hypothetical protein SLA2020_328690 [Shorea laevis]
MPNHFFHCLLAVVGEEGDEKTHKQKLKLSSYWRSSCSCRVRIALNLKGLKYECIPVNLLKGEQFSPEFTELNPIGYVPVLVDGDVLVCDSFAILMYLEEKYPEHPLLPSNLNKRAINYQAANVVSSSIQPLLNLAVLKYIEEKVNADEKLSSLTCHITKGFQALEKLLKDHAERYATGDEVFLADLFLAPQIHGAIKRFNIDMVQFPLLSRQNDAYSELPPFQDAMPEKQPDAPPSVVNQKVRVKGGQSLNINGMKSITLRIDWCKQEESVAAIANCVLKVGMGLVYAASPSGSSTVTGALFLFGDFIQSVLVSVRDKKVGQNEGSGEGLFLCNCKQ